MIDPAEVGADRLGHYGFFKTQHKESLWLPVAAWLQEQADNCRSADVIAPFMYGNRGKSFQPQNIRAVDKSA